MSLDKDAKLKHGLTELCVWCNQPYSMPSFWCKNEKHPKPLYDFGPIAPEQLQVLRQQVDELKGILDPLCARLGIEMYGQVLSEVGALQTELKRLREVTEDHRLWDIIEEAVAMGVYGYEHFLKALRTNASATYLPPGKEEVREAILHDALLNRSVKTVVAHIINKLKQALPHRFG